MENTINRQEQEDLTDTLIAISVIARLLARKLQKEETK
ncbi:hypothetical protein Javan113_0035 [Streptococcus phage Javan113]|uniref:Phage protein n=1 Tax=Streptococcus constellatus subsp. pharyngis SK1060 = CCUG 46377 TaxID=1035184 RepID=F9P8T1_STRCV|nr:hypothetical protein HMPREF1042_1240 [Streptococcus constellatus subsp. pharyngis SK1060 = CCUG 46377]EPT38174.1 hypothetical protein SAG0024_03360 [Streptococcus agalactiae FSL C1-494]EPT49626.1 hypothetical protein SAG0034_10585 [Streptococcus agalactiae FSL S3-170]EPV82299.1 hypothetical protein SAG0007_02575 [Streptococcus agalactiae FSL C1-487]EPW92429.1 hypothetical protein SAG0141_04400 [Streptococcus agalactiae MRI Z1-023]EPX12282.1 hypothetical protein SAG0169_04060 [Streptococcus 